MAPRAGRNPQPMGKESLPGQRNPRLMTTVEVSRKLIKSPTELWADLEGGRLDDFFEDVVLEPTEEFRELAWEARGVRGTVLLEDAGGFGTKVTLTAEVERS